jgi:hypothetical protein
MKQIGLTEFLNCRAVGGLDEKRAADHARPAVGLEQARHDDSHAVSLANDEQHGEPQFCGI